MVRELSCFMLLAVIVTIAFVHIAGACKALQAFFPPAFISFEQYRRFVVCFPLPVASVLRLELAFVRKCFMLQLTDLRVSGECALLVCICIGQHSEGIQVCDSSVSYRRDLLG